MDRVTANTNIVSSPGLASEPLRRYLKTHEHWVKYRVHKLGSKLVKNTLNSVWNWKLKQKK